MSICKFIYSAINIIFPSLCPTCKTKIINYNFCLCTICENKINAKGVLPPISSPQLMNIFSCYAYEDIVKLCIKNIKYYNNKNMLIMFKKRISDLLAEYGLYNKIDIIIPVPMHKTRLKQRGFNPANLIANMIARKLGLPLYSSVLLKIKNTKPQTTLPRNDRLQNIQNAFLVTNATLLSEKRILLVDDVITTGTTLDICSKLYFLPYSVFLFPFKRFKRNLDWDLFGSIVALSKKCFK